MKRGFMAGGPAVRWSTIAAVVVVAAVAGVVSYDHALAVVRANGESGAVALLYPAAIDGLVLDLEDVAGGKRAPSTPASLPTALPDRQPRLGAFVSACRKSDTIFG